MKPRVHYTEVGPVKLGEVVIVYPVDHPSPLVSNKGAVFTSLVVVEMDEAGQFETENTIYLPV